MLRQSWLNPGAQLLGSRGSAVMSSRGLPRVRGGDLCREVKVPSKSRAQPAAERKTSDPKWIVLLLMGAANAPGETDLTQFAEDDIRELEQAFEKGREGTLQVAYQLHLPGGITRRHLGGEEVALPALNNPVDGTPLFEFVRWALPRTLYRPGDRVMLVLWGHAHRFAIGASVLNGVADALDFAELVKVLARLQNPQPGERSATLPQFDIIAFDACDCSTLEMAYQLQPFARYLLASQIRMPLPGFPYHRVLARLASPKGRLMGPAEFGRWAVRRFCEFYSVRQEDRDTVSLTLLDLQQVLPIAEATDGLARVLLARMADGTEDETLISELFRRSRTIDTADPTRRIKPFVDVADLCLNLLLHCNDEEVRETARALGNLLLSPGPVPGKQSEVGTGVSFVTEHGRNACTTGRLNGVNLYAPHVAGTNEEFQEMNGRYRKFSFAQEAAWSLLVTAMAEP